MSENSNAEQIEYWNEVSGPKWVAMQAELDEQLEPLQQALISFINPAPGDSVLDIGCGCGASSLAVSEIVGDSGRVTGLDISKPMLSHARDRAGESRVSNVTFNEGDAQTQPLDKDAFDIVMSRFGIMFFADPLAAFRNFRSSLKPDGKLSFMCWRPMTENPWMTIPIMAAAAHVEMPPPPEPNTPGPFAFADSDYLKGLLSEAGFESIKIEAFDNTMNLSPGSDLENSIDFLTKIGPLSRLLQEADAELVGKVKESVRSALEPHQTDAGVELGAAVWLVEAR